jgi:ribosomal protein S18 acetylase RimI-like enzyme
MVFEARERDGDQVNALAAASGNFSPEEVDCVADLWQAYQDGGDDSGYSFLVYRDGDAVLGFACFGPHSLAGGVYDLYWIATAPSARGRGVGGALIAAVEAAANARGGRMLIVETSSTPSYAAARRFYETYGYRYEAVIHDFYAPGDDLLVFVKRLAPADT